MTTIRVTESSVRIAHAAARLLTAARTGVPCLPIRDLIDRDDAEAAYRVQNRVIREHISRGDRIVGRKIGLTSAAVQRQLGVDRPDYGVLLESMRWRDGDALPARRFLQPRVEAEMAFTLMADLTEGPLDTADVRAAIGDVAPALEICDSRIAGWDISFGDTVGDNASAGAFVLGDARPLDEIDTVGATMQMRINSEVVSTGSGADCLGDPVEAVAWLARQARELGDPLRAGAIVLSGALGPMRPVRPGDVVSAHVDGLGSVGFHLSGEVD